MGVFYRDSFLQTVGIMRLFPGGDGQQWLSLPGMVGLPTAIETTPESRVIVVAAAMSLLNVSVIVETPPEKPGTVRPDRDYYK